MVYEINELIRTALMYKDVKHDSTLALKYAYMAAVMSYSPRADVCCTIGEIYLSSKNYEWAKFWYEKAINNLNCAIDEEMVSPDYYTTIPLLKLGYINHMIGDDAIASEYFLSVLKIDPDNEVATHNLKQIQMQEVKNEVENPDKEPTKEEEKIEETNEA